MDFSYEEIEKYILGYEIDGNRVVVEFQNEAGEVFEGSAIVKQSRDIQSQVAKKVGRIAKSQARRHATRIVRSALGGGMLGRMGSSIVRSSAGNVEVPGAKNFAKSDINAAITKAYKRVSRNFGTKSVSSQGSVRDKRRSASDRRAVREERSNSRVKELTFQEHIAKYSVSNLFEQDILARTLVIVAQADGRISEDERNLITEILPKKIGSIQEIATRGEISSVEAEELNANVKKSILLLAWTVAMVDFDLSPSEQQRLNELSSLFGFASHETDSMAKLAKYETMSTVMQPYMSKSDLYEAADGLDLDRAEAERMLIQFKKSFSY